MQVPHPEIHVSERPSQTFILQTLTLMLDSQQFGTPLVAFVEM